MRKFVSILLLSLSIITLIACTKISNNLWMANTIGYQVKEMNWHLL